ncbi:folliculin domain-containing protein [Aspergillus candidus]|uniref:Vesicle coat protein n=1 Tax=Aspergillus candidus TaxID=41067 RepID=A0A2I2FJY6_ASPCN|nr:vesicle coat protein [Aspergillus candidus]PLB40933.1 vesicle coat protein [Aspergillus candidus]
MQLSLTHFCEVHGPTSIICSQVLPFSCTQCYPDKSDFSPDDTPATSHDTASFHGPSNLPNGKNTAPTRPSDRPADLSHPCPKIEDHPYFVRAQSNPLDNATRSGPLGGADGDTCASCSLTLPEDVSRQLPPGAPGTAKGDGKGRNGSPVLRSREVVYSCGANHHADVDDTARDPHAHPSLPDSFHSSSVASDASCHTHILTYLSLRGPPNPADYALLRRSSIRTLSCELLPRGLSSGPLCFGDSNAGYTVAYIFRLPDPMARGKRRSYALVALAGKDAGRAFRACPVIWRAFGRIATGIVHSAERFQEAEKSREEQNTSLNRPGNRPYTPVSSFLTGRALDPDGQARRPGQVRARNLAEIVGNPSIFAEIHAHFVALLQQLGNMFGAVPVSEERFVCSTVQEAGGSASRRGSLLPGDKEQSTDGDLGMSGLEISSGPKPIPIAPRRPVIA